MKSSIFAVTVVMQSVLAFGDSQVVNGIEWRYLSDDGGVVLCSGERDEWDDYRGGTTIDVATCGDVVVPNELGGLPVTMHYHPIGKCA